MQSAMTLRHNGSTRFLTFRSTTFRLTLIHLGSVFLPSVDKSPIKEFKIFPSFFAHPSECVERLPHIVTNLFAKLGNSFLKQINILQLPPHFFGFYKTIMAIPNLAHSCFSLSLQNPNKLNASHNIGVRCTFGCASHSVQSKALACGSMVFILCLNLYHDNFKN